MKRNNLAYVTGMALLALTASACGDDDDTPADRDASVTPVPSSKALSKLTPSEIESLCEELLDPVRAASTPEQLCTEAALELENTSAACDAERKACLDDGAYQDFSKVRCASFTSSTAPKFDCDTKVSEVTSCYAKVATWLKSLRCSQAGKAPELPACVDELGEKCQFGFSKLTGGGSDSDGGMSCEPGDYNNCTCSGGTKGTQLCNSAGVYEECACGQMTGDDYVCKSGSKSYPYDFGGGDGCNDCAVKNCCASFAACEQDTACACYWKCLADPDTADCLTPCKLKDYPDDFVEHASCLTDACETPCDLKP
ncbi:MAG TPA: hypothetical protein VJV78_37030 [Polyangiales bacterium]|nr:hypothetical protein [Polyangiales bacterium]